MEYLSSLSTLEAQTKRKSGKKSLSGLVIAKFIPRTEEETTVLTVITDRLIPYGRLWFDELQLQLMLPDRVRQLGDGKREFTVYQPKDLIETTGSAYRKLVKEATDTRFTDIKQKWNQSDSQLWENVETLVRRYRKGSRENFMQIVGAKIRTAAEEYYERYPDRKIRYWII